MTEEVDQQAEDYIEKVRGRKPTPQEKRDFDDFIESYEGVQKVVLSTDVRTAKMRQAISSYLRKRGRKPQFMVDGLIWVDVFTAYLLGSLDEEKGTWLIGHISKLLKTNLG